MPRRKAAPAITSKPEKAEGTLSKRPKGKLPKKNVAFRKLQAQYDKLKTENKNLRKAREELKHRVQEQAAEFQRTHEALAVETAERKQAEVQLRQAQKMEAIGTLAGGIAHDFNNIIGSILGYTEMAIEDVEDRPRVVKALRNVLKSAIRARELVKQILTFSRKAEHEGRPLSVLPLIRETVKLLRASIPATVQITVHSTATSDVICANPTEIQQILMNLCTNAAHAMEQDGGKLDITLSDADTLPGLTIGASPLGYVQLAVQDTGTGMDHEVMKRIFDPFYTTKGVGQGTGMGLAVVYGIAKALNGDITVESELGTGSIFRVYLPKIKTDTISEGLSAGEAPKDNKHILFIDDEDMLAELAEDMLIRLGYQATVMTDSTKALESFSADPSRFDLIFTDQTMPKMTGLQLAEELLKIKEDIPIILCTGYSDAVSQEIVKKAGIRGFLMKPFAKGDLAAAIRRVLDTKTEQ